MTPQPDPHSLEDPALSPQESIALINAQRAAMRHRIDIDPTPIYAAWGLAWLLGWGSLYLALAPGIRLMPVWIAGVLTGLLHGAALVVSIVKGVRAGWGIHGPSKDTGAMYGWSWTLGFAALTAVNIGLTRYGMPDDVVRLLWSGTSLVLVGVLFLAGGALWHDRVQYGVGLWILAAAAASVFAGVPGNYLVLALAGGGGFLLQAAFYASRRRRLA